MENFRGMKTTEKFLFFHAAVVAKVSLKIFFLPNFRINYS